MQPVVSFIVPIYNAEKYLNECIESLLAQSISKEILLIDDGSSDNSLNIALSYAKQHDFITVLHSQNQGAAAARNKGILLAKGKFIHFIDADDYILGNHYEQLNILAEQYQADIIRVQAAVFFTSERKNKIPSPLYQDNNIVLLSTEDILDRLSGRNWIPGICWSLIRREYLLKHNLFFKEGNSTEDQLFYIQLLCSDITTRAIEYPEVIYAYRRGISSVSTNFNEKFFEDHIQVIKYISEYISDKGLYNNEKIRQSIRDIIIALIMTVCSYINQQEYHIKLQKGAYLQDELKDVCIAYNIEFMNY